MRVEKIVINASPLILLFNSDLASILPKMFKDIVVPEAVHKEISRSPTEDKAAHKISVCQWLTRVSVRVEHDILRWDLGIGETEVLSYASANPEYVAMLDDMAAKKCASAAGIKTLGTGSALIMAKEMGLICSIEDSLIKLQHCGMWISDDVIHMLKCKAGE